MDIRRLKTGDERLAIAAALELKSEEEREGHRPSVEHMRDFLADVDNYLIVAAEGQNPVGFLVAYRMPMLERDAFRAYLYEIGVAAEHQRRGIASTMIDRLKALCRERGVVEIWVGTSNSNTAAKRLYASTGAMLEDEDNAEFSYDLEDERAALDGRRR
jgi:aminoglycoside 3-N-acetyltransferase I